MKRKVFCIYCAHEMYYEAGAASDVIEKIYNEMKMHDQVCPENPLVKKINAIFIDLSKLEDSIDGMIDGHSFGMKKFGGNKVTLSDIIDIQKMVAEIVDNHIDVWNKINNANSPGE